MSDDELPEDIAMDTKDIVDTFGEFHKAFPDENQHIFGQILAQIKRADDYEEDTFQAKKVKRRYGFSEEAKSRYTKGFSILEQVKGP